MYWPVITIVLQLVFLEGILSIDNAAVLGALVSPLPADKGIPWPIWLKKAGKRIEPLLGPQRTAALRVGLLGAYVGRGLMLFLASLLIITRGSGWSAQRISFVWHLMNSVI